jgi:actin-like ATPase involved in cell morphogenesis
MSDPLGLSIGTTNLVAARVGDPPLTRRSMLTLSGQVLGGFVERVGDPVPLVTADGSSYAADQLVVEALDDMVTAAGGTSSSQIAVAVPAHWTGATLRALRVAMRTKPMLAPNGVPARLVSDAVAALTALKANPGLPGRGVVALLDFGGGGTSITLADAASTFEPIETSRLTEFSGEQIDQALLTHVLDGVAEAGGVDPAGTAAVGSLMVLRDECRRAKEALSEQTAATVSVELPGYGSTVRVTRPELEALMEAPLAAVLSELDDLLLRNRIPPADVSAVVAVGGGARIPLITQRLSGHTQVPVVTTPQPALDAAVGAVLFAAYGAESDAATGMAPAASESDAATGVAPSVLIPPTAAIGDGSGSATFRALAWSQDEDAAGEPVPYAGEDYVGDTGATRATSQYVAPTGPIGVDEPRPWQRLPQLVFGLAAVVALVAVGGVAIVLTSAVGDSTPTPSTAPATVKPPSSSVEPALPPPTSEVPQSIVTVTSEAPPPPPPETETVTVAPPVTTTHTTTTTTTEPTTTTTTTPTTTSTTTTTTTTETTTTTTTPSMTTSYITVPFVPVPIPIQVPSTPTPQYQQPPVYQPPQYQQPPQFPY